MTPLEITAVITLTAIGLALVYAVINAGVELWRAVRRMIE